MENNTTSSDNCGHESVKQSGFWDGMNKITREKIGGPIAKCDSCGEDLHLSWEQWNEKYPNTPKLID